MYVLLTYGENAKTNNLVMFDSVKDIDIKTFASKRSKRELPKNINMNKGSFEVAMVYKDQRFRELTKTLPEAIAHLEIIKKKIESLKKKEKEEHFKKPILRNDKNQAILLIKDRSAKVIEEVPVSDDRWHELTQYVWCKNGDYYHAIIDGKKELLHRYLTGAKKGEIADHINDGDNTVKNNTGENLRINTPSGNAHNTKKRSRCRSRAHAPADRGRARARAAAAPTAGVSARSLFRWRCAANHADPGGGVYHSRWRCAANMQNGRLSNMKGRGLAPTGHASLHPVRTLQ